MRHGRIRRLDVPDQFIPECLGVAEGLGEHFVIRYGVLVAGNLRGHGGDSY